MSRRGNSAFRPVVGGWRRWVIIGGAAVLALVLAAAASVAYYGKTVADTYTKNVTVIQAFPEEEPGALPDPAAAQSDSVPAQSGTERSDRVPAVAEGEAQTILLLGSDTRGTIDADNIDGPQDSRSDTIMVAHIPADRQGVYVVSIMRDSWVEIPGSGEAKINAAMAYGGVPLTVQTVESVIGHPIDRVALIDFTGFRELTDALGGVTVTNSGAFSAYGYDFPEGEIQLTGDQALVYVRIRKEFLEGDYRRVQNQQAYLRGLAAQLMSRDTLKNPAKIYGYVNLISQYLTVDAGLDANYLMGMLPSLRNVRAADLHFFTAPTAGVGTSDDGQSIIILDQQRMGALKEAFATDTLGEYTSTQNLAAY